MKKNFRLFCTMCLAGSLAIFASSCKKSEEKQSVQVNLPAFEEVMGEPDEADRVYIDFNDGASFHWNGKDNILVYNICDDDYTKSAKAIFEAQSNAEGQPTGKFWYISGANVETKLDHYYLMYPVSRVKNPTAPLGWENREYFVVPPVQYYSLDRNGNPTVDPESMALIAESVDLHDAVNMKHIFGICRLRLQGTAVVDSIQLIGNTALDVDNVNNDGLTGEVTLRINRVNEQRFTNLMNAYTAENLSNLNSSYFTAWNAYRTELGYAPTETGKELWLNCHRGDIHGVQLESDNYKPFYFSVRPGAFIYGFDIKVYYHVGSADGVKTISNYKNPVGGMKDSYCIKAGTITGFRPKDGANYVTIP